jgi:hypothetical protein
MQNRTVGPVPEVAMTSRQNLEYMAQLPSAYHIMSTSQPESVARAKGAPAGFVARAQKPELLPPPGSQDLAPQAPMISQGPTYGAAPAVSPGLTYGAAPAQACTGDEALSGWERWRKRMQAKCVGYLEEFQAPPLGHTVYLHGRAQVESGEAVRMVLYHYDFEEGGARLTLRGRDQLAKIEKMMASNFFPIVIERTPEAPALAEARRALVLQVLAHGQFPVPPERVLVAQPPDLGLRGVEAELIYINQLRVTRTSGAPLPASQDVSGTILNVSPQQGIIPQQP